MATNKITPVVGMKYEWWNPNKENWVSQTITELRNDIEEGIKIMDGDEFVMSLDWWYLMQSKDELKILLTYEQSLALKVKSSWIEGAPSGIDNCYWAVYNNVIIICFCDCVGDIYEMSEEGFNYPNPEAITHHQPIIKPQMP